MKQNHFNAAAFAKTILLNEKANEMKQYDLEKAVTEVNPKARIREGVKPLTPELSKLVMVLSSKTEISPQSSKRACMPANEVGSVMGRNHEGDGESVSGKTLPTAKSQTRFLKEDESGARPKTRTSANSCFVGASNSPA